MEFGAKKAMVRFLLMLMIVSHTSASPFYVRTTTNMSCAGDEEPCLTLNQYTLESSRYFVSDSTFNFSLGDHTLSAGLTVQSATGISLQGQQNTDGSFGTRIVCTEGANMRFLSTQELLVENLVFDSCMMTIITSNPVIMRDVAFTGSKSGALQVLSSTVGILNGLFSNCSASRGAGMHLEGSSAMFLGEVDFLFNSASREGGAIYASKSSMQFMGDSRFESNTANGGGGAIACVESSSAALLGITSTFITNVVTANVSTPPTSRYPLGGGAVFLSASTLQLKGSTAFDENAVLITGQVGNLDLLTVGGGALMVSNNSHLLINSSSGFSRNRAPKGGGLHIESSELVSSTTVLLLGNTAESGDGGGIYLGENSNMALTGKLKFLGNVASRSGGGMAVQRAAAASVAGALFLHNQALGGSGGGLAAESCMRLVLDNTNFTSNEANLTGGGVQCTDSVLTMGNSGLLDSNMAGAGGAVYAMTSTVTLSGGHHLEDNAATTYGSGGIHVHSSTSRVGGHTTFNRNKGFNGGCIHVDGGSLEVTGVASFENNTALHQGGALYASSASTVRFGGEGTFTSNSAREGGALALEGGVKMVLVSPLSLDITQNEAQLHGGGIYHADHISTRDCTNADNTRGTHARISGESDTCSDAGECAASTACFLEVSGPSSDISVNLAGNLASLAGSALYGGGLDSCDIQLYDEVSGSTEAVQDSLSFFQNLISIDARNDSTSAISSDPLQLCACDREGDTSCSSNSRYLYYVSAFPGQAFSVPVLALGQGNGITPASISAHSHTGNDLQFTSNKQAQYTGKVCTNLEYSIRSHRVSELLTLHPAGACGDLGSAHLDVLVFLLPCPGGFEFSQDPQECVCEEGLASRDVSCSIDTLQFTVEENLWIGISLDENSSYNGLLLSSQCPDTHCARPPLNVTLEHPDTQCLSSREGLLCGECKDGRSVVFGSSRCLNCSNAYVALIIPFTLAGPALIGLLFALHLTVAQGTINGLIQYANLIQLNRNFLLPPHQFNILTVFIAWLNLDLGIETCFYDGMDAHGKTWLQLVFPAYLWVLMGLTAALCHCSRRVSRLLGSSCAEVTATILLLSYTRVVRTIAVVLSASVVELDSSHRTTVWREDGSLGYFRDYRHVILGVTSLLLLLVSVVFTAAVVMWNAVGFNRKRSLHRLNSVFQAYFAPFNTTFPWVGFTLVCRLYLALSTTFYITEEFNVLTTATLVAVTLLAYPAFGERLYKKRHNSVLECSFLVNLVALSSISFYVRWSTDDARGTVANFFLGVVFVEFLGILVYQLYLKCIRDTTVEAKVTGAIRARMEGVKSRLKGQDTGVLFEEQQHQHDLHEDVESSFSSGYIVLKKPNSNEEAKRHLYKK